MAGVPKVKARKSGTCPVCLNPYRAGKLISLHPELGWSHWLCVTKMLDEGKTPRQVRADIARDREQRLAVQAIGKVLGPADPRTGLPAGVVPPPPRKDRRRTADDEAFE